MTKLRAFFVLVIASLVITEGCGGGGSSTGGPPPPPPPPSFSLTVQPSTVIVSQGSSVNMAVIASGNAGAISVTISGLPNGVTASPSSFSVSTGAQQNVTVTAGASAAFASVNLTVSGTAGALSHSVNAPLLVNLAQ